MQELSLGNNEFSGTLPLSINLAHDLRVLDLSDNHLTGALPRLLTSFRVYVCISACQVYSGLKCDSA